MKNGGTIICSVEEIVLIKNIKIISPKSALIATTAVKRAETGNKRTAFHVKMDIINYKLRAMIIAHRGTTS
jgi:hypothetical protein